jgi:hypothetical protein
MELGGASQGFMAVGGPTVALEEWLRGLIAEARLFPNTIILVILPLQKHFASNEAVCCVTRRDVCRPAVLRVCATVVVS